MGDILAGLNPEQKQGVLTTEGPVLILAGAGSGKTRVLTHRVAYLIQEKNVNPYNIMAITFTNKAAGEMRERIDNLVEVGSEAVWVATFHSSCVRILRRFADRIGFDNHFTIYDADDSKSLMKQVLKKLELDPKKYKEKMFLNAISGAKNELIDAEEFLANAMGDFNEERIGQAYREYQAQLHQNNAFDFDDLIMKTVELLRQDKEALTYYQNKFQYVMVDEYQDTNTAQFHLVKLLSGGRRNLCVVGDDDQSIYKFRGANIYNILHFEETYPDATVIKLEQNYRSTQNILDAANEVIANNLERKDKALWTENGVGEKIRFEQFDTAFEEADFLTCDIIKKKRNGEYEFHDDAILYRTNAQSRLLEERMIGENIPYKIIGGINFYSRKEVKDMLAYLKTIDNAVDDLAVRRILNVPKRSIGTTTETKVALYAEAHGLTFYDALCDARNIPNIGKAAAKLEGFVFLMQSLQTLVREGKTVAEILQEVIDRTGYVQELELEGTDEAKNRIENIQELQSKAVLYDESVEESTLSGFLEEVALVADIDTLDNEQDYVVLMTLHSAKGLEFPNVYITGMEDGLFPNGACVYDESELAEERRLCYVGITRAKEHLTLTASRQRMIRGETQYNAMSRFVKEIPTKLIQGDLYEPKSRNSDDLFAGSPFEEAKAMEENEKAERKPFKRQGVSPAFQRHAPAKNFGTKIEKTTLDYGVGDRVKHQKFGEGTVESINDGGRDFEVTVQFDAAGTKKMFASFARLVKVD